MLRTTKLIAANRKARLSMAAFITNQDAKTLVQDADVTL